VGERNPENLHRGLLARHALKIIRLHLASAVSPADSQTLQVGRGPLALEPVQLPPDGRGRMAEEAAGTSTPGRAWLRRQVFGDPLLWQLLFYPYARHRVALRTLAPGVRNRRRGEFFENSMRNPAANSDCCILLEATMPTRSSTLPARQEYPSDCSVNLPGAAYLTSRSTALGKTRIASGT
jgi:hypothetical protein